MNNFVRLLIGTKFLLASLILISFILACYEYFSLINAVEGEVFFEGLDLKVLTLGSVLFALITTLIFDLSAIKKNKPETIRIFWILLFLLISVLIISKYLNQFLGIFLLFSIGFFASFLAYNNFYKKSYD